MLVALGDELITILESTGNRTSSSPWIGSASPCYPWSSQLTTPRVPLVMDPFCEQGSALAGVDCTGDERRGASSLRAPGCRYTRPPCHSASSASRSQYSSQPASIASQQGRSWTVTRPCGKLHAPRPAAHDREELVHDLLDTLKQCVERVDRYRRLGQRVGESNTKAGLIEPVIAALGWDVLDPDEVHREYRRRPADNPVDYALLLSRTPRLFIEAKGLGENIDDPKWANQTISYAAVAGVEWVALTDGAEWRLYNAHAPVPVEQKLFRAVRLTGDVDGAFELLTLLSKDNLRDNRIQELWRGFFVDRQVSAALAELFNAGASARANGCEEAAAGWLDARQRGRAAHHVAGRHGQWAAPGGMSAGSRLPGPTPHCRVACRRPHSP